jgi:hypothetical protein
MRNEEGMVHRAESREQRAESRGKILDCRLGMWDMGCEILDVEYFLPLTAYCLPFCLYDFGDLTNRQFDQLTYFQFDYWLLTTDYWILCFFTAYCSLLTACH